MHTAKFDESLSTVADRKALRKMRIFGIWVNNFALLVIIFLMAALLPKLFSYVDMRVMNASIGWATQMWYLAAFFVLAGILVGCVALRPEDKLKKFFLYIWKAILPQ